MATYDQAPTATRPVLERVPSAHFPGTGAGRCPFIGSRRRHAGQRIERQHDIARRPVARPADHRRD